ncbi:hypothetical protein P692DRAFT_201785026, partial [Suillus brevipes Sb2]
TPDVTRFCIYITSLRNNHVWNLSEPSAVPYSEPSSVSYSQPSSVSYSQPSSVSSPSSLSYSISSMPLVP